ncbi:MAG: hypothetical protein GY844_19235 [Bradyrhizobium sp.]|nr:hypothetical protein [Bradyrhizobium sp.]
MSHARDRPSGMTGQIIGQMIGDEQLVREGKQQEHAADKPHGARERREPTPKDHDKAS